MRLRNVRNKESIMAVSNIIVWNPKDKISHWQEEFQNENPIHVEVGMGKGAFLKGMAEKYPDINFIGIEKYDSVVARAVEHIGDIPNIRIIRMNALEIDEVFNHEVERLYLNFSDPWPKKRWAKRRLTSPIFLEKYDYIFRGQKEIVQKTDNPILFTYSLESLSQYGYKLYNISLDLHKDEELSKDNVETEFEHRFANLGNPIYTVTARKE